MNEISQYLTEHPDLWVTCQRIGTDSRSTIIIGYDPEPLEGIDAEFEPSEELQSTLIPCLKEGWDSINFRYETADKRSLQKLEIFYLNAEDHKFYRQLPLDAPQDEVLLILNDIADWRNNGTMIFRM